MSVTVYTHTAADGRTHYLHGKTVTRPDGRRQPRYWFAPRATAATAATAATLAALPPGYRIAESPVTRRPYLRRA